MIYSEIRDLLHRLAEHPSFRELVASIAAEAPHVCLSGLTSTAKAIYTILLWEATKRPLFVVTSSNKEAEDFEEALHTFFDLLFAAVTPGPPQLLPALDVLPNQHLSPHREICERRAVALWRMASARAPITVAPIASALLRTEDPEFYRSLAVRLRVGDEIPLESLVEHLTCVGYESREPVEMVGDLSVRGGIIDVFSPESDRPVRIEFVGDLIESMRRFDVETQRSVMKVDECSLLPLLEFPKTRQMLEQLGQFASLEKGYSSGEPFPGWELYVPLVRPRSHTVFSLLANPIVVWDERDALREAADKFWHRLNQNSSPACPPDVLYLRWEEIEKCFTEVAFSELALDAGRHFHIQSRPSTVFHGNLPVMVAETRSYIEQGGKVVFFASSPGELERLADIFQEYSVPFQLAMEQPNTVAEFYASRGYLASSAASTFLVLGKLKRGAIFSEPRIAFYAFEDLFDVSAVVAGPALRTQLKAFSADLADLKPGDYVIHTEHGVGRFLGLRQIENGEQKGDYMLLEYAGEAKLYVPLTRLDLVQRFRGAGDVTPTLDRLGGVTWARTKSRVKAKMRDMAAELLQLYAERRLAQGYAFSPDSNWQREFEDAFEFTPTRDQLTACQEIKRDMESPHPMDRLLCGDVGFGKTEVAMRSAFKALGDGKQVAVLAPTTVLCFQHYQTFRQRFAPFPVRVEMLSRFQPAKQRKAIAEDLAAGKVDIVIGTHQLLSKDIEFHDLGLLIVDEEQRFGVHHKERLKQLKKSIDVLTMTATPIPRTLHMSLLGLRDLSIIETPPKDRLSIHTVVAHFDPDLIRATIEQELNRGGQVYFVHNRVETIWSRAALIQQLAPACRIGVAHGQMSESELEKVMLRFMKHEFDLLVATTIIENGLDIPLANTLIVDHAERYGLSDLYQLRGRVGRSNRRAYAYLLVPPEAELSSTARKRLAALKEFSELGSGFKIAALDLELRGTGNLLGSEQHGHINAVGFDTYLKLLEETVRQLKGEQAPLEVRAALNLGLDIRIPPEYISDERQRLRAYKRIADASDSQAVQEVLAELEDRYGPVPEAVVNLLEFSLLKSLAKQLGIESIDRRRGEVNIKFYKDSRVNPAKLMELVSGTEGAQFTPAGVLKIPLDGASSPSRLLAALKDCLLQLKS